MAFRFRHSSSPSFSPPSPEMPFPPPINHPPEVQETAYFGSNYYPSPQTKQAQTSNYTPQGFTPQGGAFHHHQGGGQNPMTTEYVRPPPPGGGLLVDEDSSQRKLTWVMVFGFESFYLDRVFEVFRSCGPILNYEKGSGNWVFLEFDNHISAQQALGMNGKTIADHVVIGVVRSEPKEMKSLQSKKKRDYREQSNEPARYNTWLFKMGEYFFGA